MKIHIPKDIGEDFPLLPNGPCTAVVKGITGPKLNMRTKNYQMHVRWIVTSELFSEGDKTSVGEPISDNYTLVDAALWRLNELCVGTVGETLNEILQQLTGVEEGDIEVEYLVKAIAEKIKGQEANLLLEAETYEGKTRTKVKAISKEAFAGEAVGSSPKVDFGDE